MLNDFITEAIVEHDFLFINNELDDLRFFKKEKGDLQRYIITYSVEKLEEASIINEYIVNSTPPELLEAPAFAKNTDLILIYRLDKTSNYHIHEKNIFDIEENAYYFKKYVLYYSNEESDLLIGKSFEDLKNVLTDHAEFSLYKSDPLRPSLYNMTARIFIKLPFLEMPDIEKKLSPIDFQIKHLVESLDLYGTYNKLNHAKNHNDLNIDLLIEELINEELEALQNKDQ